MLIFKPNPATALHEATRLHLHRQRMGRDGRREICESGALNLGGGRGKIIGDLSCDLWRFASLVICKGTINKMREQASIGSRMPPRHFFSDSLKQRRPSIQQVNSPTKEKL